MLREVAGNEKWALVTNLCGSRFHTTNRGGGGRKRLPKFKFLAKFPIGLHVILQIQIKKFENDCYIM